MFVKKFGSFYEKHVHKKFFCSFHQNHVRKKVFVHSLELCSYKNFVYKKNQKKIPSTKIMFIKNKILLIHQNHVRKKMFILPKPRS